MRASTAERYPGEKVGHHVRTLHHMYKCTTHTSKEATVRTGEHVTVQKHISINTICNSFSSNVVLDRSYFRNIQSCTSSRPHVPTFHVREPMKSRLCLIVLTSLHIDEGGGPRVKFESRHMPAVRLILDTMYIGLTTIAGLEDHSVCPKRKAERPSAIT